MVLVAYILIAYCLGSLSGSMLIGRLRHIDIRKFGSGNAGGTNAFRAQGFLFALGVVVIDIGKGVLATSLPAILAWGEQPVAPAMLWCAGGAIFGHCYPLWHGFRGGKGAATAVGSLLVIQPLAIVPMLAVWFVSLTVTGWVGLSTMLAGVTLVPAFWWLDAPIKQVLFAIGLGLFLIFTHRSNIRAMIEGREYRFERARMKNWFGRG